VSRFLTSLIRAGVTSGPLHSSTRHSNLSLIKAWLFNEPISFGYKAHNNFGSAVHSMFLEKKRGRWKLNNAELANMNGMIKSLHDNPIVVSLLSQCHTFEKRKHTRINDVKLSYTCDGFGKSLILDLKTSSTTSMKAFVDSAIKYGYFRQGLTYMKATGINQYYIIGIQKSAPYQVYIVHLQSPTYKDLMVYIEAELNFLLFFYQYYGYPKGIR